MCILRDLDISSWIITRIESCYWVAPETVFWLYALPLKPTSIDITYLWCLATCWSEVIFTTSNFYRYVDSIASEFPPGCLQTYIEWMPRHRAALLRARGGLHDIREVYLVFLDIQYISIFIYWIFIIFIITSLCTNIFHMLIHLMKSSKQ